MSTQGKHPKSESPKAEPDRDAGGFSAEERAAMKERAQELKAQARPGRSRPDGESDVLAKIAEMPEPDRRMALRLHEIVKASAPALVARTWYGMPAYALDDKVVCFFQGAGKFKSRYSTLGFSDAANLDEDDMWPTSYALRQLTPAVEDDIARLIERATR